MRVVVRWLIWIPPALVCAVCAGLADDVLTDAYGGGPPYYARTANMDKWESPWPLVTVLAIIALASVLVAAWTWRATARRRPARLRVQRPRSAASK